MRSEIPSVNANLNDKLKVNAVNTPTSPYGSGLSIDGAQSLSAATSIANINDQGACPFKPAVSNTEIVQKTSSLMDEQDATVVFKNHMTEQSTSIFDSLRSECIRIEDNMKKAEDEVRHREEITFVMQRNEAELSRLQALQTVEVRQKKEAFVKLVEARAERKQAKKIQRNMMRQTKLRDRTIMLQEEASKAAGRVKEVLADKRKAFDLLIVHMESLHEKQRKQLSAAQERKIQYEKMINDLQTRHLKDEVRASLAKKLQVRMNHQG